MPIQYDALGRAQLVDANPTPSPYDSEYASGVAQLLLQNPLARREITQQGETDRGDLTSALTKIAKARTGNLDSAKTAANKVGLLYSGHLGKQRGEINADADTQQADTQRGFDSRDAARQIQLDKLGTLGLDGDSIVGTGQAGVDYASLLREAQDRARQRAVDAPIADPAPPPAPPYTAAPSLTVPARPAAPHPIAPYLGVPGAPTIKPKKPGRR